MIEGNEKCLNSFLMSFVTLLLAQFGLGDQSIDWAERAPEMAQQIVQIVAPVIVSLLGALATAAITWLTGNTSKRKPQEDSSHA